MAWFAPVAACVFALAVLNQESGLGARSASLAGLSFSNESPATYVLAGQSSTENSVSRVTFGWTNRGKSNSSVGSMQSNNAAD